MPFASTARRVLVVEDDEHSRSALQRLLEQEGFEVHAARDGDEGLRAVSSFQPDVIVLDLVLPRLNGFDAANLLKMNESTARIPLVAVTASWLGSERDRLSRIGFQGALRKPFAPQALIRELRRVLESRPDARPLASPLEP